MFPVIPIGPLALQTPGLIMLLGFWLSLELAGRQGARLGLAHDSISSAGFYGALAGIGAARFSYVWQHWTVYRDDLLGILALNPQSLDPGAGLAVGLLVAGYLLLGRQQVQFRLVLGAIAPGMAAFASALALANFASGNGFGTEANVPWAIELWGIRRHPTQLYELAAGLGILFIVWRAGRQRSSHAPGMPFLLFVALYGGTRLLLEPLQATSVLLPGGFRAIQVAGLISVMIALWLLPSWTEQAHPKPTETTT
jgi:prolipoprotein diacylglyceryltransferase